MSQITIYLYQIAELQHSLAKQGQLIEYQYMYVYNERVLGGISGLMRVDS